MCSVYNTSSSGFQMGQVRGDGGARRQPVVEASRRGHVPPPRLRAERNHQDVHHLPGLAGEDLGEKV